VGITGVHALIYTSEPEEFRAVLRDVFGWPHVEEDPGWLIFRLPPAELGVHPLMEEGGAPSHQLSFMCDDLNATVAELEARGITTRGHSRDMGWGVAATVVLPGDVEVMLYEPRHATAI